MKASVLSILGCVLAVLCLAAPGVASAQQVTYNFSGAFPAPATGTVSGTYVYDVPSTQVVSITINTTAGLAADGVTSLPASTYTYAGFQTANNITYAVSTPATGLRGGFVTIAPNNGAPTMALFVRDSVCTTPDCTAVSAAPGAFRTASNLAITVAPAPVPTLTEWAMILFGLVLAGFAVVTLQRRRLYA